jgi:hypothetical protein
VARFSTGDPGAFNVQVLDDYRQVASPITLPWQAVITGLGGALGGVEYGLWVPFGGRVNVGEVVAPGPYWVGFIRPAQFQSWNWVPGVAGWTLGTGTNSGSMAGAVPTTNFGYPGAAGISAWVDADEWAMAAAPADAWNGSAWVPCDVLVWDGGQWVPTRLG